MYTLKVKLRCDKYINISWKPTKIVKYFFVINETNALRLGLWHHNLIFLLYYQYNTIVNTNSSFAELQDKASERGKYLLLIMYLIWIQPELPVGKCTNLIQSLLLQTDDVKVKICPQAIGPVKSDSTSEAVPVGLVRDVGGWREGGGIKKKKKNHLSRHRLLSRAMIPESCNPRLWHCNLHSYPGVDTHGDNSRVWMTQHCYCSSGLRLDTM